MASTKGIERATTSPVRRPRLRNETVSTMITASLSDDAEELDRLIDDFRLIGDDMNVQALRQVGLKTRDLLAQALTERDAPPPLLIATATPTAG